MAKVTLTDAMRWAERQLNQYDVPAAEQAALFRLILHANANFWAPVQVSLNQFSAKLNSDKRTVKKIMESLINRGWVINTNNGYLINFNTETVAQIDTNMPKSNIIKMNIKEEESKNECARGNEPRQLSKGVLELLGKS